MDIALIKYAEYDIDGADHRQYKYKLVTKGLLKSQGVAGESAMNGNRHMERIHGMLNGSECSAERLTFRQVKRECCCYEWPLMVDGHGRSTGIEMAECRQRHHGLGACAYS